MCTLIRNVRIVQSRMLGVPDYPRFGPVDILIKEGRISEVKRARPELDPDPRAKIVIDGKGLYVAPGLVDVHSHFRDPGQTHKEDILSGAEAAKHGGYTTIVTMANTTPVVDSAETIKYILDKGATTGVHIYPCATVTKGMEGLELTDMPALVEAGAVGFSDDGKPILDEKLLQRAMLTTRELGVPINLHEEDPRYINTPGFNNSSVIRVGLGITGAADIKAEYSMVKRDRRLAEETGAIVNFQHISCYRSVEDLREARRLGHCNIFAEATPHHLFLNETDAVRLGSQAKMNPPLRGESDRLEIVKGFSNGTLNIIATDHAPHTTKEKNRGPRRAPSGVIGLETAFALMITKLRDKPGFPTRPEEFYAKIIDGMSTVPARMYGFDAGVIRVSGPADLMIFDPDEKWTVNAEEFASKARNTPFDGWKLTGKVVTTICEGKVVYCDPNSRVAISHLHL